MARSRRSVRGGLRGDRFRHRRSLGSGPGLLTGLGRRSDALDRLGATSPSDPLDLLVVGGGITGAGIALDSASRGLRTGLVERADFASGTSSKSSKLVHGGLRYLEQREFSLMREAAQERDLLRQLAPHLVEPIPFVLPVSDRWNRARFALGLWAYDALASFKNLAVHRYLGVDETQDAVPALPPDKIKGGFLFYDCRNDDVRLVMEVLIQAVRYGATVVNHAEVTDLEGSETCCRASARDSEGGGSVDVFARRIVVAAGVWGDKVERLAGELEETRLRPSKGVHLSFSNERLPMGDAAAFIPDVERERFLFVIPWLGSVIVGTTDTPYQGDIDEPSVGPEDRRYILDSLNAVFDLGLSDADVTGSWAGLRPLIAGRSGSTADLSRKHSIYDIAPGIFGITGGKLTTYRRMAKDAVDRVAEELDLPRDAKTRWIRLGSADLPALSAAVDRRAGSMGLGRAEVRELIRCFGDRCLDVLDVAQERGLAGPLQPGFSPLAAVAPYCAEKEMAIHLSDLLQRRTRLSLIDRGAGVGVGSSAVAELATSLGWDEERRTEELTSYISEVERERSLPLGTDESRGQNIDGSSVG